MKVVLDESGFGMKSDNFIPILMNLYLTVPPLAVGLVAMWLVSLFSARPISAFAPKKTKKTKQKNRTFNPNHFP